MKKYLQPIIEVEEFSCACVLNTSGEGVNDNIVSDNDFSSTPIDIGGIPTF